jgi:hypothetical protein
MIKYFEPPEPVYGLYIPTIGSGKAYITRVWKSEVNKSWMKNIGKGKLMQS